MVLEYCSRGTLSDAITRGALCLPSGAAAGGGGAGAAEARRGVPDVPRIVRLARDVASAMAYLHGQVRGLAGCKGRERLWLGLPLPSRSNCHSPAFV